VICKRMKNSEKFYLLSVFGLSFFVSGCGHHRQSTRPPTPVVVTKVIIEDIPLYIEAIQCCVASKSVSIIPQASGQIIAVRFKQGQTVKVGDPLYTIDLRVYEANFRKAEAQLETAKAKMKVDVAQLERSKALIPQNYISQHNMKHTKRKLRKVLQMLMRGMPRLCKQKPIWKIATLFLQ
jgi:multidrug efflux pump subunit AcrA (membrane-fusion protein)